MVRWQSSPKRLKAPDIQKSCIQPFARNTPLEELLQEGAEKLQSTSFGNPTELHGRCDSKYWLGPYKWGNAKKNLIDHVLILKNKTLPSVAYQAMFDKPSNWTFDCATFVQAVYFYCLLQRCGPKMFNERLKRHSVKNFNGKILFRSHLSTGLYRKKEQNFSPVLRNKISSNSNADIALREAPIGTHIVFTNPDAPKTSSFYNENAIKIEPDLFVAKGIHTNSAFANRAAIERKLMAKAVENNPKLANVKQIVSVT